MEKNPVRVAAPHSSGFLYRGSVSSNALLAPLIQRGLLQVNFGADTFLYPLPAGYLPFEHAAETP